MSQFIGQRLLSAIGVLLAVSLLVFGLLQILPGDAAAAILGSEATGEQVAAMRRALELDQPVYLRYVTWLGRVLQGDLGRSVSSQQPVAQLLFERSGATLLLTVAGMLVATIIGIASGVLSATRRGSIVDRLSMVAAMAATSTPAFWLGLMLVLLFAAELRWFPTSGMYSPGESSLLDLGRHLVLPALTIGLVSAGALTRLVRSSMLDVLRQEYVTVARAKGLRERTVTLRHALRNALLPVVTVMGLQVGHMLGGAVVTETVFAWPGIGSQLYAAINNRDLPVVIGGVLLTAVTFVLVNLLVDIVYAWIDPRIQYR